MNLQPFGLLVLTGILVGSFVAVRRAREAGIAEEEISDAVKAAVITGLVVSHLMDVLINHPGRIAAEGPLVLLKFWDGLSSMEGFLGAFIGMWVYFRRKKKRWLKHADIIVQALVVGWIFGRLGCTVAHDHLGMRTDFFLAFAYPGGPRLNLGFLEFLYTLLVMLPAILWVHRRAKRPGSTFAKTGTYVAAASLLYAPIRFVLDFLRATDISHPDVRFLGLTDSQYSCIALAVFGVWMWFHRREPELQLKAATPKKTAAEALRPRA